MKNHADYRILYLLYLVIIISLFVIFKQEFFVTQAQAQESSVVIETDTIKEEEIILEEEKEEEIELGHLIQIELDKTYTEEDLRYLSSIIWCEAGNQCLAGKQAVGIVVMNRIDSPSFEDTVKGVIYERGQFSPVSSGSINKALNSYDNNTLPVECIEAALYALSGNNTVLYEDIIYEINYLYFNNSSKKYTLKIQDHYFK